VSGPPRRFTSATGANRPVVPKPVRAELSA